MNKKMKALIGEHITVADLIEHLKTMDQSLPVGRSGHYGEFYPMNGYDFYESHAHMDGSTKELVVVLIEPPDIGPEPD